jgi:hypothetical protein
MDRFCRRHRQDQEEILFLIANRAALPSRRAINRQPSFAAILPQAFLRRRNYQRPSANPGEQANHKQHEQHQFRRNPVMVRTVVLARQCLPPGVAYAKSDYGEPAVARHGRATCDNQPQRANWRSATMLQP